MREKMKKLLPKPLIDLANACSQPLYVVGGAVRDFIAGLSHDGKPDWDICSPMPFEEFLETAKRTGFEIRSVFKNTGTVKLQDGEKQEYEYCSFRSDKYVRGVHVPVETFFTDDIALDARRRDFTANAVYYDVKEGQFVDPLNGIPAILEKRLTTVASAQKVFGEDGLRLMRLARQTACLGFSPDAECLAGAKANAHLIQDISPERIFTELQAILLADKKYGVKDGHYQGLKLLEETGVLAYILPELAMGKDTSQRADYHHYSVLEHSFRAVLYADEKVRLAALLHDVGKPACFLEKGNFYDHHTVGARIAKDVLARLKAPKKMIERIPALIEYHMLDFDNNTRELKLRRFFVTHYPLLEELLLLKQADYAGCRDLTDEAPTCVRWRALLAKMREETVPFSLKELAVSGKEILGLAIPPQKVGEVLQKLLLHVACHPTENEKERLLRLALSFSK